MTEHRRAENWLFWIWWVLANLVAWPMGAAIGWVISQQITRLLGSATASIVGMAVAGAIVGLGQWAVLQARTGQSGWWIPVSSLGLAGGFAAARIALDWDRAGFVVIFGSVGVLVGIVQWMVLGRYVPTGGWWIPGTCVGYVGAILVSAWLEGVFSLSSPLSFVLPSIVLGVVFGAISGLLLAGLLSAFGTGE